VTWAPEEYHRLEAAIRIIKKPLTKFLACLCKETAFKFQEEYDAKLEYKLAELKVEARLRKQATVLKNKSRMQYSSCRIQSLAHACGGIVVKQFHEGDRRKECHHQPKAYHRTVLKNQSRMQWSSFRIQSLAHSCGGIVVKPFHEGNRRQKRHRQPKACRCRKLENEKQKQYAWNAGKDHKVLKVEQICYAGKERKILKVKQMHRRYHHPAYKSEVKEEHKRCSFLLLIYWSQHPWQTRAHTKRSRKMVIQQQGACSAAINTGNSSNHTGQETVILQGWKSGTKMSVIVRNCAVVVKQ
jgi:hypothetical protein